MYRARNGSIAVLLVFVSACTGQGLFEKTYHFFYSPADHVSELLAEGELDKADQVWSHQSTFFAGNERLPAVQATQSLADALSARLLLRFEQEQRRITEIEWPASRSAWPGIKARLAEADAFKCELARHKVLSAARKAESYASFLGAVDAKMNELREAAPSQFRFDDADFFDAYPVALDRKLVLSATRPRWSVDLGRVPPAEILSFHSRHRFHLDEKGQVDLARLYFRASHAAHGSGADKVLAVAKEMSAAGLPLANVDYPALRVHEFWSYQAGAEAASFVVVVESDLPRTFGSADWQDLVNAAAEADIVVITDLRSARVARTTTEREPILSSYRAGTRSEANPKIIEAIRRLEDARSDLHRAERAFARFHAECRVDCSNPYWAKSFGLPDASRNYSAALSSYRSTPETIRVPVFEPYLAQKLTIRAEKSGQLAYYVIERRTRSFRKGSLTVEADQSFAVVEGVRHDDPEAGSLLAIGNISNVVGFERLPMGIPLSRIFEDVAKHPARPLPPLDDVRREIDADRAAGGASRSR
ncbi:MAG: hypothetical protein FJX60_04315 [Alphaproteobacteria bacterium]|nr:hypothetical protein [Alphaproteobacteria bacterium]